MVMTELLEDFDQHWNYNGEATYDPQTEKWSVTGDVYLKTWTVGGRLPHQFDKVQGYFDVSLCDLTTLWGCPISCREVDCSGNPITSLEHVSQDCQELKAHGCPLVNLVHQPLHLKFLWITWSPDLPLLRCLQAKSVILMGKPSVPERFIQELTNILNDPEWAGKGKLHMLNCALALKKAGEAHVAFWGSNPYLNNAKW